MDFKPKQLTPSEMDNFKCAMIVKKHSRQSPFLAAMYFWKGPFTKSQKESILKAYEEEILPKKTLENATS